MSRCGGRVVLVENRDGLPSDESECWAERAKRGEDLTAATCMKPYPVAQGIDAAALGGTAAAVAMQLAGAAQDAVSEEAVSDLTDEKLLQNIQNIMNVVAQNGGPAGVKLSEMLQQAHSATTARPSPPRTFNLAAELPENIELASDSSIAQGSNLWLACAPGTSVRPQLLIKKTVTLAPSSIWAGGQISKGSHRLQLVGPCTSVGAVRFRSPGGLSLCIRGPLTLTGPLRAVVAAVPGYAWLDEGVLRCTLVDLDSQNSTEAYCELHGAEASEELERAPGEACALELPEGSVLSIDQGGCVCIEGSCGVDQIGADPPGVTLEQKGQLELCGLGRLELLGVVAFRPAGGRILAQVGLFE